MRRKGKKSEQERRRRKNNKEENEVPNNIKPSRVGGKKAQKNRGPSVTGGTGPGKQGWMPGDDSTQASRSGNGKENEGFQKMIGFTEHNEGKD